MPPAPSLIEQIQGLIERTYALDTGIDDLAPYLVGDEGVRELHGDEPDARRGARLLIRKGASGSFRLLVYFPDALVRRLEKHHPLRELHRGNIDALATLVEELDHLLLLADRARRGGQTSLLEMELQANVTKVLVIRQILGRHLGRPPRTDERAWIRWHVLEKGSFIEPEGEDNRRYEEARKLAGRIIGYLDALPAVARLAWLRRFARTPSPRRLREAARLQPGPARG